MCCAMIFDFMNVPPVVVGGSITTLSGFLAPAELARFGCLDWGLGFC
jgi:hypothetical protein